MKLVFEKNSLLSGINTVMKAVPSKTTLPILECILIDATEGEIALTANDMELAIRTVVKGRIEEPGRIAVEARFFSEMARKLPESDIVLTADESGVIQIVCDSTNFRFPGRDASEFTGLPVIEHEKYISISQFSLKETIKQTIFSIAQNENNRLMTGELFQVHENELKVTSLDGHRISIRKVQLKDVYEDEKVVIPGKTLNEISRILPGEADKEVLIFFQQNHVCFEFDQTVVVSRLIEGEYFRVDQMLSEDYETRIRINKKDLLDSIERSTLLIRENDKKPIILDIEESKMGLSLNSALGSMKDELLLQKQGKDIMIGFNPRFLIEALRVIDDEEVDISFVNPKAPCYIRGEDGSYLYLILPVNFSGARA